MVKQRGLGICPGYENLNDLDELCRDRLLALLSDCPDIDGAGRRQEADRGKPLAGKSTLNRLELTPAAGSGHHDPLEHRPCTAARAGHPTICAKSMPAFSVSGITMHCTF